MGPFKCERTCFASRIEKLGKDLEVGLLHGWMIRLDSSPGCCWGALDVRGLDRLSGFPVIHDVLEMKSEYFSMNAVIVRDA